MAHTAVIAEPVHNLREVKSAQPPLWIEAQLVRSRLNAYKHFISILQFKCGLSLLFPAQIKERNWRPGFKFTTLQGHSIMTSFHLVCRAPLIVQRCAILTCLQGLWGYQREIPFYGVWKGDSQGHSDYTTKGTPLYNVWDGNQGRRSLRSFWMGQGFQRRQRC
jgi:hypothetical protein